MATLNIWRPDAMKTWIEAQTEGGQYNNASEYVRDLIRRDQRERERLGRLQAAIDEGRSSGVSDASLDDIWHRVKLRHEG